MHRILKKFISSLLFCRPMYTALSHKYLRLTSVCKTNIVLINSVYKINMDSGMYKIIMQLLPFGFAQWRAFSDEELLVSLDLRPDAGFSFKE